MSLLVVGTLAIDTIETPTITRRDMLGGSAFHCAYAASFFTPVHLVSAVGHDWPAEYTELLHHRGIDTSGVVMDADQQTFRWHCRYQANMKDREDVQLEVNVWNGYRPQVPSHFLDSQHVFLANALPVVQRHVLKQLAGDRLVVADTIDQWIIQYRADLELVLADVEGFVLNDDEARLLTDESDMEQAARKVLEMVGGFVVIKLGGQGVIFGSAAEFCRLPAFPTTVVDPTGAGDTFAGGMLGWLAATGDRCPANIKQAIAMGIVVASFNVEGFGLERVHQIDRSDIERRLADYLSQNVQS